MWRQKKGGNKLQWFKHDTDTQTDAKLNKVTLRYGPDGYAIYFKCLELIGSNISQTNISFELEHDSEIIADMLKVRSPSPDKSPITYTEEIMRYLCELGLFENNSGHITCFSMLKRLDTSMTSNPQFRKLITKAKEEHGIIEVPKIPDVPGKTTPEMPAGGIMQCANKIFEAFTKAELPMREKSSFEFSCGTFKNGLEHIRGKNITTDDLCAAVENYASLFMPNKKKTWYTNKANFETFCKNRITDFLPGNFIESNYYNGQEEPEIPKKETAKPESADSVLCSTHNKDNGWYEDVWYFKDGVCPECACDRKVQAS